MHPLPGRLGAYYINLDRCPERAAAMQSQLAALGVDWIVRHPATDGAALAMAPGNALLPGEVACFHSHLQVLRRGAADGFTLVLEDDAELSPQWTELLARTIAAPLPGIDIVFLECQPQHTLAHLSVLWDAASRMLHGDPARRARGVELMDAKAFYKWGTCAYLVTPHGHARVAGLVEQWLREGPVLPLDRCFERALVQGLLQGAITIPFLATTDLRWHGRSAIGNGERTPHPALMLMRRLLFAGGLQPAASMAQALAAAPADPALQMFAAVARELAQHQRWEASRA